MVNLICMFFGHKWYIEVDSHTFCLKRCLRCYKLVAEHK